MNRFKPGKSGNLNGRPKGSPNVSTGRIRALWQDLMTENMDQLREDFQTLKPKERLELAVKMSHFLLPKLQSIEISNYPDWAEFVMLTPEERAEEIIRLKQQIEDESEGET